MGARRQQSQPPVEMQHHADRGQAHHQRGRGIHDSRAHQVPDRVQVIGELRHQVAREGLGVIPRGEAHQVEKQVVAQVVFHIARDADQNPAHPELKDRHRQRDHQQQPGVEKQPVPGHAAREAVNRGLDDQRQIDAQGLRQDQRKKAHHVALAVAARYGLRGSRRRSIRYLSRGGRIGDNDRVKKQILRRRPRNRAQFDNPLYRTVKQPANGFLSHRGEWGGIPWPRQGQISRRPSIALSIVTSSANSSSEPTGTPMPMRVTLRPRGLRSLER